MTSLHSDSKRGGGVVAPAARSMGASLREGSSVNYTRTEGWTRCERPVRVAVAASPARFWDTGLGDIVGRIDAGRLGGERLA
jgi:hypothetical protein